MAAMKERLIEIVDTMCNMEMQPIENVTQFLMQQGYTDEEIRHGFRWYFGLGETIVVPKMLIPQTI